MALQQCLSGGRKILMTNLPGSSTHLRHLFGSGIPVLAQKWNYKYTIYKLAIIANNTPISNSTNWLCTKTFSPDYLQLLGFKGSKDSNENNDDDKADGKDDVVEEEIHAQLTDIFLNKSEMTSAEWKDTINLMAVYNDQINDTTRDAVIMKKCLRYGNYHLANSYLHHMEQDGRELNLSSLGSYLQLCGEQVEQCGEERVLEYYHKLMSQVRVSTTRRWISYSLCLLIIWSFCLTYLYFIVRLDRSYFVFLGSCVCIICVFHTYVPSAIGFFLELSLY